MNYLNVKKQILEWKLEHVQLLIEKNECLNSQRFERAASIREREKEIFAALKEQQKILLQRLEATAVSSSNLEDIHKILDVLLECSLSEGRKFYTELNQQFIERMKVEIDQLWIDRRRLQEAHRFADANEIQKQIMEFGEFLTKHA
jgi:hypothetical protein